MADDSRIKVKVGMVGDAQVGKTSLMVRYTNGIWDSNYIETLGVNFMDKTINIGMNQVTLEIWDLGGQAEFLNMLSLVCTDAAVILFMFDLTRKSTLNSIKNWYRQTRAINKVAIPVLVGTKYDLFVTLPAEEQVHTLEKARLFARAMHASALVFTSASHSINVKKLFNGITAMLFGLTMTIPPIVDPGSPILEFYPPRGSETRSGGSGATPAADPRASETR